MDIEPIEGKPTKIPPGRVEIRLDDQHHRAYRKLYSSYQSILNDLPILRDRDFDGRAIKVTPAHVEALNRAFASLQAGPSAEATAFGAQDQGRRRLFKRIQYLS